MLNRPFKEGSQTKLHKIWRGRDDVDAGSTKRWLQNEKHIGLAAGILAALIKSGKEPEQTNEPT